MNRAGNVLERKQRSAGSAQVVSLNMTPFRLSHPTIAIKAFTFFAAPFSFGDIGKHLCFAFLLSIVDDGDDDDVDDDGCDDDDDDESEDNFCKYSVDLILLSDFR